MIFQPPKAKPNQAQLIIIPETALELGKELGSGAFGTVYKVLIMSYILICELEHFDKIIEAFIIKYSSSL